MAWSAGPDAMACVSGQAAEKESPQVMGPGILPTRDFGDGHAVNENGDAGQAAQDAAAGRGAGRRSS